MTGTQKFLGVAAAVGAVIIAAVVLSKKPDDPKPKPDALETSSGVVATTTVTPPTTAPSTSGSVAAVTSGKPVDVATLAQEAKIVADAREAMNAGEPRKALAAIERYERIPEYTTLKPEATIIKIEALTKVGRKTDALALAMSTRDDPKMAPYAGRVDAVLQDAGLIFDPQTR